MLHLRRSTAFASCVRFCIASYRSAVFVGLLFTAFGALAQRPLGTDVSHWQGTGLNWNTLKNDGISFAWGKASQGTTYVDDTFKTNVTKAKASGIVIGAYHFANYDQHKGTDGATDEAYFFWSTIKNYVNTNGGAYLMPMLDAENISSTNGPSQSGYTKTTFSQWVNAFCNTLSNNAAASGVQIRPVIYTGTSFGGTWLNSTVTNWIPWYANWPASPNAQTGAPSSTSPWTSWTVWQYADTNWSGGDSDVFNGTTNQLIKTLVIGGSTTNAPFFISQPSSRYADRGSSITMRAPAGNGPLKYQWRFNSVNISVATNSTLTLANIQATNGGNYTVIVSNSFGSITSAVAKLTVNALWAPVFSDTFDANSSANWTLNRSSTNTRATFVYDYSALGIAAAPNSTNGTTKGLRMEANLSTGVAAALSYSPTGQSFSGVYRLHFDMWINANGPFPAGGTGSTEAITAGVGTAGNRVEWGGSGSTADGVWFMADGEGQGSTAQGDITAYSGTALQDDSSGSYLAGTDGSVRSCTSLYYVNVFPGSQTPPPSQSQTGSLDRGTMGFAWHDVVISKNNSVVEWIIDGLKVASVTNAAITASNVFVGYWDPYNSVSSSTNLSFGLVDNLRVEVPVVGPAITGSPQSITVNQSSNATFTVTATGTPSPTYQWLFNGTNIANATATNYTRTNVQPADAGTYSVVVTNAGGSATASATLTVNSLPTITTQPTDLIVNAGAHASFSVGANGTVPLTYQWRFNNTNIASANATGYSFTNAQSIQGGYYSVIVSNVAGFVISTNALLTVTQMQFDRSSINVNNGILQFNVTGAPGGAYVIEASTNLVDWDFVETLTNSNGTLTFADPLGTNTPDRFYRVSAPR
ncbi:MAG: Endoglucanase [Verrucomicrobiales bacterium]|nr:Endoglucanase [Verrucomicrobiales bacterium]